MKVSIEKKALSRNSGGKVVSYGRVSSSEDNCASFANSEKDLILAIFTLYLKYDSRKISERIKCGLRKRKELLLKLKAPAGTSASNDDISQYL